MDPLPEQFWAALGRTGLEETPEIIAISLAEQRLRLFRNRQLAAEFPVSTSARGPGCRAESFQTPTGLHRVARKIGHRQPTGTVFRERIPAGVVPLPPAADGDADRILTRILWLEGLQPGHNRGGEVDTFSRHIYIHGTNHEELIGRPASHGCVRMRNADVITLFDAVAEGTLVWIA